MFMPDAIHNLFTLLILIRFAILQVLLIIKTCQVNEKYYEKKTNDERTGSGS